MKKLICAVLAALLSVSMVACGQTDPASSAQSAGSQSTDSQSTKEAGAYNKDVEIKVTRPSFFGDASDYADLKASWPQYMKEKFDANITVNAMASTDYISNLNLTITAGDATGLVGVYGIDDIISLKDQGAIMPFTESLKDNEAWNSLPQEMRDMYLIDGEIWGIPAGFMQAMFTRTFRQDWLDNLGLTAPTNLDELYEVSRAFTFDDPDKNGKDDTYGITSSGTWTLQDIFQAFGARLDRGGDGSITYDPNDNAFVDSMLKPEMAEALTYLNKMYSEGILDKELFTTTGAQMREKYWAGNYGSTFYWLGFSEESRPYLEKITPEVAFTEVAALEGNLSKNINHVWYSTVPYVMIKDTKDASDMINRFSDLLYGDLDGYLAFHYGIEGTTYRKEGNTVYNMIDPATKAAFKLPNLSILFPKFSNDLIYTVDGKSPEETAKIADLANFKSTLIKEGMDAGKLYPTRELLTNPTSETYLMVKADIKTAFDTCVSSAITGTAKVEDAIKKYLDEVKALGGQQILDESNEAQGLTGTVKYE